MNKNIIFRKKNKIWNLSIAMLVWGVCALAFTIIMGRLVFAATISQGYKSAGDLPIGTIVSFSKDRADQVEKASIESQSRIAGVITDLDSSVIDVQPKGTQVRVTSVGSVRLFVATLDGNVKEGDKLSLSPITGVATKFTSGSQGRVVAVAQERLDASDSLLNTIEVQTSGGESMQIKVGLIDAILATDTDIQNTATVETDNNILTQMASQVTGKSVSTARIITSGVVFVSSIVVAGVILQGSVRGTFVSLGRNPLSQSSLIPALARMSALAIFILSVGSSVAYFILST